MHKWHTFAMALLFVMSALLVSCNLDGVDDDDENLNAGVPSQSATIQISEDNTLLFVVNKIATGQANVVNNRFIPNGSLTIIQVRDDAGKDDDTVLAEVEVGRDPRSVSVSRDGTRAFVSNGADNSVSAINIEDPANPVVESTIAVGSEPRGTALTPSGKRLYVANFSDATVSVIDTAINAVIDTIDLVFQDANFEDPIIIHNPYAIAITDDGDDNDDDETIYVGDFFARGIESLDLDEREGFDDGKEARIAVVDADLDQVIELIRITPLENTGFNANRQDFRGTVFGGGSNEPQGGFFNQLHNFVFDTDTNRMYIPTIGASPEPPVQFNVNVQALIASVSIIENEELAEEHINLNNFVKTDEDPAPPFDANNPLRLDRAFTADTVAMAVSQGEVLYVSRGGSFCMRGTVDFNGKLDVERENGTIVRIPTGNIPNGVVMNNNATRAYVNAEVSQQVTVINLVTNDVIDTIDTSQLPAAGSEAQQILIGKLAFFTSMGLPAENLLNQDVRNIDTHTFRNLASNNSWSSCASCHSDGLTDSVTWIFATGPRQTVPLDGSFAPNNPDDQRAFNWNAVRSSVTDFNNNARNVQGGLGFSIAAVTAARNPNITPPGNPVTEVTDAFLVENHGPNEKTFVPDLNRVGISDSLNLMTLWVQKGVRTYNRPSNLNQNLVNQGRLIFEKNCVECHSGDKWTTSQVLWDLPLFFKGGQQKAAEDVQFGDGPVILAFVGNPERDIIRVIGTFDANNPIEVRGAGGAKGKASFGANNSFNPPSLLGVATSSPYGHHGRAEALQEVFFAFSADGLGHPPFGNDVTSNLDAVVEFLKAIDENEPPFELNK